MSFLFSKEEFKEYMAYNFRVFTQLDLILIH